MLDRFSDRKSHIQLFFLIVTCLLIIKLAVVTIVDGSDYREMSLNKRLKKIPQVAKRGEVLDRNGQLLAGNTTAFTVQLMSGELPAEAFGKVAVRIFSILDEKGEKHIEFPIRFNGETPYYQADVDAKDWLIANGYEPTMTAEQVFQQVRDHQQISADLDAFTAQKFLIMKGVILPISVKEMKFLPQLEKKKFLDLYGLPETAPADEAYNKIRQKFKIPATYSSGEAYKIMSLYHALREKGYRKYEPIKIANGIHKETAILIEEMGMDLPGIKVEIEPVRNYPFGRQAAHVLGYMGKIASDKEYETFVTGKGYLPGDLIGKSGIEGAFENVLRGQNGYKYIEVDAYGRQVREVNRDFDGVESSTPKSGKNIALTLDVELQKTADEALEKALAAIQVGGTYQSPWGSYKYSKAYPKAQSGAAVVVDVKTGEILALANYPSYDLNLFSTGISSEDWAALQPQNPRDPLAPRPLFNLAAQTAVQPGSTFKMITGFAAVSQGLSPTAKLMDGGAITTADGTTRACWIWNKSHGNHGYVDLPHALEVSCNYYFFDVSNGKDYYANRSLGIDMNAAKLIEYAKLFGLDEASGVEIGETVAGVPDPAKKKQELLSVLRRKMKEIGPKYFPAAVIQDEDQFNALMTKINALADENLGRRALVKRLIALGANPDEVYTEGLADIIKYSFFSQMRWFEGDTFNLAIGQGGHTYTPLQMARYIAAIANDGTLNKLTLIKSVDGVAPVRETPKNINGKNIMHILREGMYLVANGDRGTSRTTFAGFPIQVGAKTGTAEKEGKLPPEREEDYIKQYLRLIAPKLSYSLIDETASKILAQRNEDLGALEQQLQAATDPALRTKLSERINNYFAYDQLSRGSAMREAIKKLSNGTVKDEDIDRYKDGYDNFTWFVSFAPYENPEIAVVVLIPQGGAGGYAGPIVKDIYAKYFNLQPAEVPGGVQHVDADANLQ